MTFQSAIYAGHVLHVRSRPKKHSLRYSVLSLLVDLDEINQLNEADGNYALDVWVPPAEDMSGLGRQP